MDITLLGTGGMLPLKDRFLTSCYVEHNGKAVLIDCGEGTQVAIAKHDLKLSRIEMLLITHSTPTMSPDCRGCCSRWAIRTASPRCPSICPLRQKMPCGGCCRSAAGCRIRSCSGSFRSGKLSPLQHRRSTR